VERKPDLAEREVGLKKASGCKSPEAGDVAAIGKSPKEVLQEEEILHHLTGKKRCQGGENQRVARTVGPRSSHQILKKGRELDKGVLLRQMKEGCLLSRRGNLGQLYLRGTAK